jgi:peptidoglycan/xylan/chitin deacetylase (PgdA/CDA1 family)
MIEQKSMGARIKSALRGAVFGCGALTARHRLINRDRLTVVMFHRVLSPEDPRWVGADPEYTLSDARFADAIAFLRRYYSIVALDDLLASLDGRGLPPCPLLITLDDGWADSAQYALPELRALALPAVVFVAAGAVGRREAFWQERLYAAWRTRKITVAQLTEQAATLGVLPDGTEKLENSETALRRCISALEGAPTEPRSRLVDALAMPSAGPDQMLSGDQIRLLAESGIAVGAHGYSHEPLTGLDAVDELKRARTRLEQYVSHAHSPLRALSFPHGRYDAATLAAATRAGFELMFTSDPVLTPLSRARRLGDRLIGRIDVPASAITDAGGRFSPARMATWLFLRSARRLAVDATSRRAFTTP